MQTRISNELNNNGYSPLHFAAKQGNVESVKALLASGENPLASIDDETARDIAIKEYCFCEEQHKHKYKAILKLLPFKKQNFIKRLLKPKATMQDWFLKRAKKLKYKLPACCFGISMMAVHAILCKDRNEKGELVELIRFMQRNQRMSNIAIKAFASHIQRVRDKIKANEPLSELEELDSTIPAFIEEVTLYQNSEKYLSFLKKAGIPKPIRSQDISRLLTFMTPDKLAIAGGMAIALQTSGVYSPSELEEYFTSLRSYLRTTSQPTSIELSSGTHALTVGYDPLFDHWIFVNANSHEFKVKFFNNDIQLAQLIAEEVEPSHASSKKNDKTVMSACFYTTHDYYAPLSEQLEKWTNDIRYQKIHEMTSDKLYYRKKNDFTWFDIACRTGQFDTAQKLRQKTRFIEYHKKSILFAIMLATITSLALFLTVITLIPALLPIMAIAIPLISLALVGEICILDFLHDRSQMREAKKLATIHQQYTPTLFQKVSVIPEIAVRRLSGTHP